MVARAQLISVSVVGIDLGCCRGGATTCSSGSNQLDNLEPAIHRARDQLCK